MRAHWSKTAARIDAMSLRERALVFAALAAALIALVNLLLLDPLQTRRVSAEEGLAANEQALSEIHAEMGRLGGQAGNDPDQARRDKLGNLRSQLAELDETMEAVRAKLVAADQMVDLLRSLLDQTGRLELISLRTLAAAPVALDRNRSHPKTPAPRNMPALYRHGVELKLRGPYGAIHDYLSSLEGINRRLYWDEMKLVSKYPISTLTLTVHTLSLEEAWLSL